MTWNTIDASIPFFVFLGFPAAFMEQHVREAACTMEDAAVENARVNFFSILAEAERLYGR